MRSATAAVLCVCFSLPSFSQATHWLYSATGGTPSSIQGEIDRFRNDLGNLNPNEARSFTGGRREINWDAVGGTQGNPNLPGDFFHKTSPRGLVMSTPGSKLKVSGDQDSPSFQMKDVTRDEWGTIEFAAFSNQKFFAPLGSSITDIEFRIPGTDDVACVPAFGAIFMDVDRGGQSFMEVALTDGSVRKFMVPVQPVRNKGFSFVGVRLASGCIVSVRLNSGDHPVDTVSIPFPFPDGVAIDDFIYGEPQPVARPGGY
jgi:hypothetical protein